MFGAQTRLDKAHEEEQASIKEQRANAWSELQDVLTDAGKKPEEQKYKGDHNAIAQEKWKAYQKFLSPETKKKSTPLGQLFQKLVPPKAKGGAPQAQGAAPQPNQLQPPASQAQVAPPQQQPAAQPQGNLQPPAAQAQVRQPQGGPPQMFTQEEQTQRQQAAQVFKDNEATRVKNEEARNAQKIKDDAQAELEAAAQKYAAALPPDEGKDFLKRFTEQQKFGLSQENKPPAAEDIKNLPGSALKGQKDAFGNEIDPNGVYTKSKDGKLYPEAPAPKSKSEEELTDESLHGATPEIRRSAKENLEAMQRRKVDIAKAGRQTTEKSQEDKAIEETAQSLAKNDLTRIQDVTSMRSENRLRVYARAKEINPNFSTFGIQQQINMETLYTTGKMGDNLQAFGTFLEHAGEASDVINNIRLSGTPAINKPLNWWRKNMEGDPDYQALLTALEPVRKEYESFLLGNHAMYEDDRKAIQTILSDNASPAQYQGALKQMGKTAKARYTEANQRYKRVRHKDLDDPFSDEAREGARKIGVDLSIAGGPPASGGENPADYGEINGKHYHYKGSGDRKDLKNWEEVPSGR